MQLVLSFMRDSYVISAFADICPVATGIRRGEIRECFDFEVGLLPISRVVARTTKTTGHECRIRNASFSDIACGQIGSKVQYNLFNTLKDAYLAFEALTHHPVEYKS